MTNQGREVVMEGCVWKELLTAGSSRISQQPTEGSACDVRIENIFYEPGGGGPLDFDLASALKQQNTKILTKVPSDNVEVSLVIGEADCSLDRRIELALQLMKDNEKSRIIVSLQDPVSGLETEKVSFEATLLKKEKFKPVWEWTPEEKYQIALKYKEMGVKLFKEAEICPSRCKDAFYRFSRACKILLCLEPIDDLELDKKLYDDIKNLRVKLYINMAACQMKYRNFEHVVELCNRALAKDEKNVLALFRRGSAYGELRDFEKASQDLKNLLEIEPNNKQATMKLQQYNSCLRQASINCNEMVKRMFK